MNLVGVVLAGGASRRFGTDKLCATVDGTPLVARVARALGGAASEVWISVESESHARALMPLLPDTVHPVIDREEFRGIGPLAGVATALLELEGRDVLFLPGDMPWVPPEALSRLVSAAGDVRLQVASPLQADGFVDTLVLLVRAGGARRLLASLRSPQLLPPRSSEVIRSSERAGLVPRALLTQEPGDFGNINTPEALAGGPLHGNTTPHSSPSVPSGVGAETSEVRPLKIPPAAPRAYWEAREFLARGETARAVSLFVTEADLYRDLGISLLEYHALTDALLARGSASDTDPGLKARREALKRSWPAEGSP